MRTYRPIFSPLIAFMLLIVSPGLGLSQHQQSMARLLIRVDNHYDDSPESLKLIEKLIDKLPKILVTVRPGDNPSSLILREYGFGRSDKLEKSYALLESAILRMNGWSKPEDMKPGPRYIPNVPRRAAPDFNENKLVNYIPKIAVFLVNTLRPPKNAEPKTGNDMFYLRRPDVLDQGRPASQSITMDIEAPAPVVRDIMRDEYIHSIGTISAYPMTVDLADAPEANSQATNHLVLDDDERKAITSELKRSQRDVFVFILDTGWPNEDEYTKSRQNLTELINFVWNSHFNLRAPRLRSPKPFVEPSHPHCKFICRSLNEFHQLGKNRIREIYVPLTREQDASPLLIQILQTSFVFDLLKKTPDKKTADKTVPDKQMIKRAREAAEDVVTKHLLEKWEGQQVRTDKAILDALLRIGQKYAEKAQTVFFVNESWTVPHGELTVDYPDPLSGVVIAAVGNNPKEDANIALRNFAQRCVQHKDTLAVMNMDRKGTTICNSSIVNEQYQEDALAVGFDGLVSESENACGTSFAAPRVAWLLAVAESVRTEPVNFELWGIQLHHRLRKARTGRSNTLENLRFDPVRFLELTP